MQSQLTNTQLNQIKQQKYPKSQLKSIGLFIKFKIQVIQLEQMEPM